MVDLAFVTPFRNNLPNLALAVLSLGQAEAGMALRALSWQLTLTLAPSH